VKLLLTLFVSISLHLVLQILSFAEPFDVRLGNLTLIDCSSSSSFRLWPRQKLTHLDIRPLIGVKQRVDRWLLSYEALRSGEGHDVRVAIWLKMLLLVFGLVGQQIRILGITERGCHNIS